MLADARLAYLERAGAAPPHTVRPLPADRARGRMPYVAVLVWHDVVTPKEVWFDTPVDVFHAQLKSIRAAASTSLPSRNSAITSSTAHASE